MIPATKGNTVVLIPAYEAEKTIGDLVKAVHVLGFSVLVVDDASSDQTGQTAEAAGAEVIRRPINGGKGQALRDGFARTLENGFDWVFTVDADGQHLPEEMEQFLEATQVGDVDLVLGNRMHHPENMPPKRLWTNRRMSTGLSEIAGVEIPDSQCGFRLLSADYLRTVPLWTSRFEIESEMVLKAGWAGFKMVSVPISSVYADDHESFISPFKDTLRFFLFLRKVKRERSKIETLRLG